MSAFLNRLNEVAKSEELTREDLAEKTGLKYTRISNLFNKRGHIRAEEIEAIGKAFPEYKYWLAFGDELPEAGQISPMTKQAMENLETARKTGT